MKIEIHQNSKPMRLTARRATDSPTIWIEMSDESRNEMTLFVTPEQAQELGAVLTKHAADALRIQEVLNALNAAQSAS